VNIQEKYDDYKKMMLEAYRPDPNYQVSEWADRYRYLSNKASAEPGKWRTSRTPYLKEIMDRLSTTDRCEQVVFMKGSQVGGTEAGNNWIGYIIDHAPAPILFVQPTLEMAKRNTKQRLDPLIEESSRLSEKVAKAKSRASGNTMFQKEFHGGILNLLR
jgi:phage terminase large subunit GpA-like protein